MTDAPRCETCRWWDFKEGPWVPNDTHACLRMGHNGSFPHDKNTLAHAFSCEEADAVVFTHATFGCVMHEPKEAT